MKKGLLFLFVLLSAIGLRAQNATGDTLTVVPDTTTVELGKTYYFAARSKQYPVRFVATADGYLTFGATAKISASSTRRNNQSISATSATGAISYTDAAGVKHSVPYMGSYTKDSKTGQLTGIALAKGDVFECKVSTSVAPTAEAPVTLELAFTEGKQPLTLLGTSPADGSEWSGAVKYKSYSPSSGAVYCSFSSLVDIESVKATVKVGGKEYTDVKVAVESSSSYLYVEGLAETMKAAAAEGLVSAGDEFTVTLSGLKDRVFSDVTLADQTFTFKMAATACSDVAPKASTSLDLEDIQTVTYSFDGKVNIDNAKFYMLNLADSSKTDLTATVDGTSVVINVAPALGNIPPRLFDIIAEGVVDAKGNAISYSTATKTLETGKLKAHYGMSNGLFAPTLSPANGAEVFVLNKFTLTFPGEVVYNPAGSTKGITLTYMDANWDDVEVAKGSVEVSATNPNVVTITLDSMIGTPNEYTLGIPAKLFWRKDAGYKADDLTSSSKYGYNYYSTSGLSFTVIPSDSLLDAPDTTALAEGVNYIYGKKRASDSSIPGYAGEYWVKYTAETDGYLALNASQKVTMKNMAVNGSSLQTTTTTISYKDAEGTTHSIPYYGAYSQDTKTGSVAGIAMAKGDVFTCKTYTSLAPSVSNIISVEPEFTTGVNPLTLAGVSPASGSEWSGAMKYKGSGVSGGIYCSFSSLIDRESVKVSVKAGGKVFENVHVAVESYYTYLCVDGLADTLKAAAAAGLIGAGDEFTVTISGLRDRVFPAVTLEDQTFTYKMGPTACTGVTPAAATALSLEQIQTVTYSFDGKVNIDKAKFYMFNLADSSKVDLTATVEGTDLKINVASALGNIPPRLFDIIAEGVVDAQGKTISYSTDTKTLETCKLKAHYGMSNGLFKPVADPADGSEVTALNKFTLTFPGEVIYNPAGATKGIALTYMDANWDDVEVAKGSVEVSATNPNVVTITLDSLVGTPQEYTLEIPAKLFWYKDAGYNADDLSTKGSAKYGYSNTTYNWKYSIPTIAPDSIAPVEADTLYQLDTLVLYFPEEVEYSAGAKVAVVTETGDTITKGSFSYPATGDKKQLVVTTDEVVDSLGAYKVVVPAGSISKSMAADNKNLTLVYSYIVKPLELDFLTLSVENGQTLETLSTIEFTLNKEVGFLEANMLIGDDGINAHGATLAKSDAGVYKLDFTYGGMFGAAKLLKGVTYTMKLEAWSSEEAKNYETETPETLVLTYVGNSEPEKVSEVTLVSATPEGESVIQTNENVFTYTFSAPVKVTNAQRNMGQGVTQEIEYKVEENKVTVTMGAAAMLPGSYIAISLTLEDMEGNRLAGTDNLGYYLFNYTVYKAKEYDYSLSPVSIDPAEGQVDALQGITFTFDTEVVLKDEAVAYIINDVTADTVKTMTLSGNQDDWKRVSAFTMLPLTVAGYYTVVIPQGVIMTADYYETETAVTGKLNGELKYKYTVGTPVEPNSLVPATVTPDTASTELTSLSTLTLTFDKWVAVHEGDAAVQQVWVLDAAQPENSEPVTYGTCALNDDFMSVTITLGKELGKGTYKVVVGEGVIYSNDGYNPSLPDLGVSNGAVYNPSLSYTYVVKEVTGIDAILSIGGEVEVYDVNGVLIRKAQAAEALEGLSRGIYIINGQKIAIK